MSPTLAFAILTWVAIALLFLAVGAVLREVRQVRALVVRNPAGYVASPPPRVRLSTVITAMPQARVVLAADSTCPACVASVRAVAARADVLDAVVLTHEPADAWADLAGPTLPVVSDPDAWRAIGHLTPPVLMWMDPDGVVRDLVLPIDLAQVDAVLNRWAAVAPGSEGAPDAVDAGAHS